MSLQPPPAFVELMERLGVADYARIIQAGRGIRRHERELQSFEAIWIDALVRARVLTPFQAREIRAGRGEQLRIGPYLLCEKLAGPPYVDCYRAMRRETGEIVRLAVQRGFTAANVGDSGVEENRSCFASPWIEGRTVAQALIAGGRFSAAVVLEIARAMTAELAACEKSGRCHGDMAPWNVLLTSAGETVLLHAGLRAMVRPEEGFASADLLPEAYDYLAPERVLAGTPPDMAGDIFACGCVCWQMLCGRPPLAGGDSLAKFRAVQSEEMPDVRRLAPETPAMLAEAISACLRKEPNRRPSPAELAAMLGPASKGSRPFLARTWAAYRGSNPWRTNPRRPRTRNWPVWLAAVVGCISVMLLLLGPTFHAWRERADSPKAVGRQPRGHYAKMAEEKPSGHRPQGMIDREVRPAAYNARRQTKDPRPADYLLETDAPRSIETLFLQRGQRAIGQAGRRATVLVPASGLRLDGEEIRLENVDFVWNSARRTSEKTAMILFSGSRADFRGCRFFAAKGVSARPAVLQWTDDKNVDANLALPSGRLNFADCLFHHAGVGIDSRRQGAIAIAASNCFLFEIEGFLRLDHPTEVDETITLDLNGCTMRNTGPLLLCRQTSENRSPGTIAVQSESCVFALRKGEPLVAFDAADPPDAAIRKMRWNGSSSLVAEETAIGGWKSGAKRWEPLDDTNLAIAGLVRSRLEFAENANHADSPAAAKLLHWQAPLPTLDPPGVKLKKYE